MSSLRGQRIVVTRAPHQAEQLAAPLRELGAEVILLPVIAIAPPSDPRPLQHAAEQIDDYDWIVFTSANAVAALAARISEKSAPPRARIAVIGTATRGAVEEIGWTADAMPSQFVAETLVDAMAAESLAGKRVLLPCAAVTREVIPRALSARGADVHVVEAYRNAPPQGVAEIARLVFSTQPLPDWVTVTSSSAVENLVKFVGVDAMKELPIASIGPITSESVRKHGLSVAAEPAEHTIAGLIAAMAQYRK
jgi:uroporphyrinogen III methyltransferase/synthase